MDVNWFQALVRFIALTTKRIYDILASYLLFWVVYFASVAVVFHVGLELLAAHFETSTDLWWVELAAPFPATPDTARLATFIVLHGIVFLAVRRPLERIQPLFDHAITWCAGLFDRVTSDRLSLKLAGEAVFSVVVTALLVPFVLQPTLVPDLEGWEPWAERGANLVDGTASVALVESVIGLYRLGFVEAVVAERGVTAEELANAETERNASSTPDHSTPVRDVGPPQPATGALDMPAPITVSTEPPKPARPQPVMDRWDDTIMRAVDGDIERFAYVKAFMYVESAGRQYAVSRTGCAGLMQFCSGTARSHPFKQVFGTGQVYTCRCRNGCSIEPEVRVALESGIRDEVEAQASSFPCQLTDARFDPDKAVRAGALYINRLYEDYGGNIQIMYIGYNSGPAVAKRVWRAIDGDADASLETIAQVLPDALRPYYGTSANVRARSLVEIHLPKIERARARYATR
jgi:hypothetical protein